LNAFYNNEIVNDVANIGNDYEITILDLARKIIDVSGSKSKIIFLPALKEGDMTRRCPDITVMKKLLDRRMTTLEEGIIKLIQAKQEITV
jgi:nucleoside-diphosphate-sugar epimerase